jgi:hypothetical protein
LHRVSPLKISLVLKCFVLLTLLLSFSVPSVADRKILSLQLLGIVVDFSFYQIFLIVSAIWIVVTKSKILIGRIERVLIVLFCFIISYNLSVSMINGHQLLVTSLRGIFNFGINVLCAFWIRYVTKKWLTTELFSLVFIFFTTILALSSVAEFSFLKFSPSLLEKWRSVVWGEIAEPDELLKAGGVILDPDGMARVGGLIGAPENLGMILAFALPFTILARISLFSHILIASFYALISVIAGTRMLGFALVVYIIIILHKFEEYFILKLISILMLSSVSIGIITLGINNEVYSRFTMDAFWYELLWRGEIFTRFLDETRINKLSPLIGASLGQFERGGDYEILARVKRGVLGGDIVVAYGLGGIGGILVLLVIWIQMWKIRNETLNSCKNINQANRIFMILVILKSLFVPVLMNFVLISNIFTFASLAFLISLSNMIKEQKTREPDDD